ncbi:hypothetical protein [Nocardia cyriacigeorgica]|uniref:Uncharacterized protein n=1 Tax=Nocardia cyriacigeorgica TaxID=135487 RepID=A0A5R8NMJ4_9NOCA|nr:hypothetical protein [Nocardia cyriacigeorgica]TLF76744.1 hypothetical protein FEK34_17810 [Nocardia cyriacigeorgica]
MTRFAGAAVVFAATMATAVMGSGFAHADAHSEELQEVIQNCLENNVNDYLDFRNCVLGDLPQK